MSRGGDDVEFNRPHREQPEPTGEYPTTLIKAATSEILQPMEETRFRDYLAEFVEWADEYGKKPEKCKGQSERSQKRSITALNQAIRVAATSTLEAATWQYKSDVPDKENLNRVFVGPPIPANWCEDVITALDDHGRSGTTVSRTATGLEVHSRWRHYVHDEHWKNLYSVSDETRKEGYKDTGPVTEGKFTTDELNSIINTAVAIGTPDPEQLTDAEREKHATRLSQRFRCPKQKIDDDDIREATKWMWPSLIAIARDGMLRNSKVEKVKTTWLTHNDTRLEIKKQDGEEGKVTDRTVVLSDQACELLDRWLEEREGLNRFEDCPEKYENHLWLTRERNPVGTEALNRRLNDFMGRTNGISPEDRNLSWKSIKKTAMTHVCDEGTMADAVRISGNTVAAVVPYNTSSVEKRRELKNSM